MAERPGLLDRARLAMRVFSGGLPWEAKQSASPFLWPAWREGKPEWHILDWQSYVSEGFNRNSLIYSAIMYKARAILAAPMRAYTGDPEQPELLPQNHPLAQLLARPNVQQSQAEFNQQLICYLNVAGNCYVRLQRPKRGGLPTAMHPMSPDRMFIVPGDGGLLGYVYVPEGKTPHTERLQQRDVLPILPEDVVHVKFPNPMDPLEGYGYGLSPMSALAQSADVDNSITTFLKTFFARGAMPNVLLKFDNALTSAKLAEIRTRWEEVYGGSQNWTKVGVLDQGGSVQELGFSKFREMGFAEIDERNESRVLGPFGVPPILIGTRVGLQRSTYSNYEEARRAFWQDTLIPELALFDTEFEYYLQGESGEFVARDLSKVPALRQDIVPLVDAAAKLWSMGVPANMAVQTVGLTLPEIPGGDIGYLPMSVLPSGVSPEEPEQSHEGAAEAEDEAEQGRKAVSAATAARSFRRGKVIRLAGVHGRATRSDGEGTGHGSTEVGAGVRECC